ncbi:putative phage holin [Sphaerisporangium sp. NPDC004334]
MIHPLGSALVLLCAVLAFTCAVFYGCWFRWWTSEEGRHLFAFMGVIALVLGMWTALLLSGGTAWQDRPATPMEWARLALAAVAAILADRLRLLIKGKRNDVRRRKGARRGH